MKLLQEQISSVMATFECKIKVVLKMFMQNEYIQAFLILNRNFDLQREKKSLRASQLFISPCSSLILLGEDEEVKRVLSIFYFGKALQNSSSTKKVTQTVCNFMKKKSRVEAVFVVSNCYTYGVSLSFDRPFPLFSRGRFRLFS